LGIGRRHPAVLPYALRPKPAEYLRRDRPGALLCLPGVAPGRLSQRHQGRRGLHGGQRHRPYRRRRDLPAQGRRSPGHPRQRLRRRRQGQVRRPRDRRRRHGHAAGRVHPRRASWAGVQQRHHRLGRRRLRRGRRPARRPLPRPGLRPEGPGHRRGPLPGFLSRQPGLLRPRPLRGLGPDRRQHGLLVVQPRGFGTDRRLPRGRCPSRQDPGPGSPHPGEHRHERRGLRQLPRARRRRRLAGHRVRRHDPGHARPGRLPVGPRGQRRLPRGHTGCDPRRLDLRRQLPRPRSRRRVHRGPLLHRRGFGRPGGPRKLHHPGAPLPHRAGQSQPHRRHAHARFQRDRPPERQPGALRQHPPGQLSQPLRGHHLPGDRPPSTAPSSAAAAVPPTRPAISSTCR